ncbi:MAG: CapA family protein [Kineothrix sp.]
MKRRGKRKNLVRMLAAFCIAFAVVMAAGLSVLMGYYIMAAEEREETNFSLFAEAIPEAGLTLPGWEPQEAGEGSGLSGTEQQDSEPEQQDSEPEQQPGEEVVLAFGGDILLDPGYSVMASLLQRGRGAEGAFSQDLLAEMRAADILMLNNEFPYSDRGTPTEGKQFTFRAKPDSVRLLDEMGVDIVSLANNHAFDYGETALLDTLDILKGAGIPYAGAGVNLEEAAAPVYFTAGGVKLAYVSATQIERMDNPDTRGATDTLPGVFRCLNPDRLLETVREAAANSDFVVVYIHWGTENVAEPDWAQMDQAPRLVEAGADLVIGDHPHCLQPVVYIDQVPVLYSLGNFWFNSRQVDTCLIKATVDGNGLKSLQFLPAQQKDCFTSLLHGGEKERVLDYMRSISPGVHIDEEGYITCLLPF